MSELTQSSAMASSAPAQNFPQFTRLPREIRERIWYFCLPRHVVPLSNPLWAPAWFVDRNAVQQCWPTRASNELEACAPPFIATVCSEAREVAFRWGGVERADSVSLGQAWVQRTLDTVLYGWLMSDSDCKFRRGIDCSAEFFEAHRLHHPSAPIALLASLFCNFTAEEGPDLGVDLCAQDNDTTTYLLDNGRKTLQSGENESFSGAIDADVVVETIYIHAKQSDILSSGLFGAIADEPSQLVDCDDDVTIAKYRALFNMDPKSKERDHLVKMFDTVQSHEFLYRVDRWHATVQWRLLMRKWLFDQECDTNSVIYGNPNQVFDESTSDIPVIETIDTNLGHDRPRQFNASHPWVLREVALLPKIRPKIWFAYCTRNCPIESDEELEIMVYPHGRTSGHWCNPLSLYD